MSALAYWVIDAFTDRLFAGNPAAVVLPERALPDALMQQIATENNLSETAFAVPEADGYRLRWFTPTVEVDLCGHATLATSFILKMLGQSGPFRFHTRSGTLIAQVIGDDIELDFPSYTPTEITAPAGLAEALGIEPILTLQSADVIAVLPDAASVAALQPDITAVARLRGGAVIVTAAGGDNADITSRYFAPAYGIPEDPATGSLHTQVVPYWASRLGREKLFCHQASRRGGRMVCTVAGDRVLLRGAATLYASGTMHLGKART